MALCIIINQQTTTKSLEEEKTHPSKLINLTIIIKSEIVRKTLNFGHNFV